MERGEAKRRLTELVGQDLRPLADKYGVTVRTEADKLNKGWVGHVMERHLGIPINSSRAPNFGTWELKVIPLRHLKSGKLTVKETMAITMIDPVEVGDKAFEESHLFLKLQKILVAARIDDSEPGDHTILHGVYEFDLSDSVIYERVKADYDLIRKIILTEGFERLKSKMGVLVQPRTKGTGHGSTSRAFYARTGFVKHIVGIEPYTKHRSQS